MRDVILSVLGCAAGAMAVFAIVACGANAVWCFACAIIALITGLIIGGDAKK